jgi:hypothetical protein
VRPDRLDDVTGAHDGAPPDQAGRDGGQPVLLAAVHVHHVGGGHRGAQAAEIAQVGGGAHAAEERERLDPAHALLPRAVHDQPLGAAAAAEYDRVAAALQLARDTRRPVGVRRPAPAGDELENLHAVASRR